MKTLIAIPTYNSNDVLLETVYSALNQSVESRVIIIDNCSTDDTYKTLIKLKEERINNLTILKNSKNHGRVGNWNKCLEFFYDSSYSYIKFLFPGDLIESTCIEECEKIFEKYDNLAAVAFPYKFIDHNNNVFLARIKKFSNKLLNSNELLEINFKEGGVLGAIISHIYNKKKMQNQYFDENHISKLGFDIKITENASVFYLDKTLASFIKITHKTFDSADSVFGYLEFSFIEITELIRLKKQNKINSTKFKTLEQSIILNTIKRVLRFARFKTIFISIYYHFLFIIMNNLRKFKNSILFIKLRKLYYSKF